MKKQLTEEQIIYALRQADSGTPKTFSTLLKICSKPVTLTLHIPNLKVELYGECWFNCVESCIGLARFTMLRTDIAFGREIVGTLFVESIMMPILYAWLLETVREQAKKSAEKHNWHELKSDKMPNRFK